MLSATRQPWRHDSELVMLRDMIFPHHIAFDIYSHRVSPTEQSRDRRADAINTIASWRLRSPLAHPLTATIELVGAQLFADDVKRRHSQPYNHNEFKSHGFANDLAIRSTFATSLCRFVNGFVDKDVVVSGGGTTGGGGEGSMFVNATKIGLPASFVEFRHRCTHGRDLPSVQELRLMNSEALEWLYGYWWKVHAKGDPGRAEWEERERDAEIERAVEFHREMDERRRTLTELLQRAEEGDETVERPTLLVCGRNKGKCQRAFLLEFDLKRHRKGSHQEVDGE